MQNGSYQSIILYVLFPWIIITDELTYKQHLNVEAG